MYPSTPIHPLLSEMGLISAQRLLNTRQKTYAYQLLTMLNYYPTKQILLIRQKKGEENL